MKVESIWRTDLQPDDLEFLDHPSPGIPPSTADVLIVGAGLVGLFIARELRRRFQGSITVIDSHGLAQGASGHNTGGLFAGQTRHDHPLVFRNWAIEARERYAALATGDGPLADTGIDFLRSGSLRIDGEWPGTLSEYADAETIRGNRGLALDQAALSECEPSLADNVTEGFFCPEDATFHPLRTALALARDLVEHNVHLSTHLAVTDFVVSANRLIEVACGNTRITAGQIVLASGWATGHLATLLGNPIPVIPAKGQAIATNTQSFLMKTCVLGETMVRQLPDRRVIAGGTQEFVGPDLDPTETGRKQVLGAARKILPRLASAEITRTWVGLRPYTPDEMPVIDRLPGVDNVLLAAGHFTKGVLLAPVTGDVVANWLVDGSPGRNLDHLSARRFSNIVGDNTVAE